MTVIGDLTLNMIGTGRVRTEYEGATIEGLVTDLDLDVLPVKKRSWGGDVVEETIDVVVDLQLGNINLHGLARSHPCEVIS